MKILLHICCINCLIYPSQILRKEGHDLTGFWFNPNIHPREEYDLRLNSLKKHSKTGLLNDIIYPEKYKPEDFFGIFENTDSSGASNGRLHDVGDITPLFPDRCISCYRLRLEKTAEHASMRNFDAFTTTLLISPYQNFDQINMVGKELANRYNIAFHLADFRPYFKKSMAAAKEIGTYRQKYCGCIYSMEERFNKNHGSILR